MTSGKLFRHALGGVVVLLALLTLAPLPAMAQEEEPTAADKQLLAAHGFFQRGHFKLARDEYEAFLKENAAHRHVTTARYALAVCQYRLGAFEPATTLIEQVLQDGAFKQKDEALAVLGHCYLSLKQYDKALTSFERILTEFSKSAQAEGAALNRAQVLYMLDKKQDALSAAEVFLDRFKDSKRISSGLYYQALCLHDLGRFEESSKVLRTLLKDHEDPRFTLDANYLLGQCLTQLGQHAEAAETFKAMVAAAPAARKSQGQYALAVALYRDGKYDEATKELNDILKNKDDRFAPAAMFQLGLTQLAGGDVKSARQTLTQVAQKDEQRAADAKYWLAQCDIREEKFEQAHTMLDGLANRDPKPDNIEQILFDRATCRMALEQFPDAAAEFAAFREAFKQSLQNAQAMYFQAYCNHKAEQYEPSLKLCQTLAVLKEPAPSASLMQQSRVLEAENLFLLARYDEAAAVFAALRDAATEEADQHRFTYRLGQCASVKGDFTKTIELLEPLASVEAVAKDDQLREALFVVGDAYLQTEQYDKCADVLKKFAGLTDRHKEEVTFKLGLSQMRGGDKDAAAKTLGPLTAGDGNSSWVQRACFELGQLTYNNEQHEQAKPLLQKVVAGGAPVDLKAPASYLLAWIAFDAGQYPEAATAFKQTATTYAAHEVALDAAYYEGYCLKLAEQWQPALTSLDGYIKNNANGNFINEANYHKGTCLAKLDQHTEAVAVFAAIAANEKTRTDAVLYDLAWSQRAIDKKADAEKSYRTLLTSFANSPYAPASRAELAELLYENEKYAEAVTLLEQALAVEGQNALEPGTHAAAQYRLGWCFTKLNQHAKAAPAFDAFVMSHPKHELTPSARYQGATSFIEIGKLSEAETHLAALLAEAPDHELAAVGRLKLGEVQNETLQFDKAAATFNGYLSSHPNGKFVYLAQFGSGWANENLKKYADARTWYNKVIASHNGPTAARAQFQIGETYFAEQKFDEAVKELMKVEIVYDYPQWAAKALYEAGRAFQQLGNVEQAKRQYQTVVTKYKDEPEAELAQKQLNTLK